MNKKDQLQKELQDFQTSMEDNYWVVKENISPSASQFIAGRQQAIVASYGFQFKEEVQLYLIGKILDLELEANPTPTQMKTLLSLRLIIASELGPKGLKINRKDHE